MWVVCLMFGAQVCSVVCWLFGCGLVGLLVVMIVPLFLSFLATPGLCCFLRVTLHHTDRSVASCKVVCKGNVPRHTQSALCVVVLCFLLYLPFLGQAFLLYHIRLCGLIVVWFDLVMLAPHFKLDCSLCGFLDAAWLVLRVTYTHSRHKLLRADPKHHNLACVTAPTPLPFPCPTVVFTHARLP